jgi:carbonic anhydrase
MSLFSSQTSWPPQCLSANQSPINLSQSSAKPCNITCDLVMDDDYISQATVSISDEGLILSSNSLGSCKFRGQSYVCQALHINHPSHHTLEGVQADGEVTAIFKKPTGELLCVSSLFRVNPSQTSSYTFFKQFVPYGLSTGDTQVKLQEWSLSMMVPTSSPYYTYDGSTVVPPCSPCEWVVFKTMINMDTGDFAYLVRNSEAGSRSLTAQGSREVFYNDTQNLSGVMPNDGKMYLRLKPTGSTSMPSVSAGGSRIDLKNQKKTSKEQEDDNKNPTTLVGKSRKALSDHVASNGGIVGTVEFWLMLVAIGIGCYLGYSSATSSPFSTEFLKPVAKWSREMFDYLLEILINLPSTIYAWTIGWVTFLLKPRIRDTQGLNVLPAKLPVSNPST